MRANPILRGDLRARLGGGKALAGYTLFLSLLAVLAILSLPPELGRMQEVRQQGLLQVFLIIQALFIIYLTSATASGEIAVEGEKPAWDLAASPFSTGTIARGKLATSAAFAALLVLLGLPLTAAVAGIRGQALAPVAGASIVIVAAGTALGTLGALYAAVFESDFARTVVHWFTLLIVVLVVAMAPSPWRFVSPVHAIPAAMSSDFTGVLLALAAYGALAAAGAAGLAARIGAIRREAVAA
ncbi:MAG TPA: hypothetical protein VGR24_01450 [bacterium]|jgi:hypothetical protein|nr:hypothetical protein [bacterium]